MKGFLLCLHACGMRIYSEILAANCESTGMNEAQSAGEGSSIEIGTRIAYDSKLSNLGMLSLENEYQKKLGVEYYIGAGSRREMCS